MDATYIKIAKAPSFAPDAKAVVRVPQGLTGYKYWYVDSLRDARDLCKRRGWALAV